MSNSDKTKILVLDQDIDDDRGSFRVLVGTAVRYLNIESGVFSEASMCIPSKLVPQLPPLPDGSWTDMDIRRDADGAITTETSTYSKYAIRAAHACRVEFASLALKTVLRSGVQVVEWRGNSCVAKYACFHYDLPRIATETWAYEVLEAARARGDLPQPIAARFLGQIAESGRLVGVLLEELAGDRAGIADLAQCEAVVRQLHAVGIVHGDLNRHNFVVDRRGGQAVVRLVDFEKAETYDAAKAEAELASLPDRLKDESETGGVVHMFNQ